MANQLDLEEQEQLDQIKHFWNQYGNAITWALIVVLGSFASWNFYQYWQRNQATQAAALFDEVERSLQAADGARIERVFAEMKDRFGSSTYAQQAGLLVAKQQVASGKSDAAQAALNWVTGQSADPGYQAVAKLRLAGLLLDSKKYDEALKLLGGSFPASFEPLVADRLGDVLALQGNKAQAVAQYQKAYRLFAATDEYRSLVEVKLNALGLDAQGK
ncbi:MAG: tetratricopeptide repeat protein [Rhodoferax sp.]|nr:tetratricopeptide repeat protein [Rhodoferax sp.]